MYTIYVSIILYFFHCFKSIKQKNTIKFKIFLDFPYFSCFFKPIALRFLWNNFRETIFYYASRSNYVTRGRITMRRIVFLIMFDLQKKQEIPSFFA